MSDSKLNLYAKLLKITEEIGKIEKTGRNSIQNYSFIEQAQVVAALRPQLAKYGVFIIPETLERTVERFEVTRSNGKPGVDVHVNVKSRYTIINADNPEERIVCEWDGGEAIDSSDKATNKATTASHKNFLMKLFNISDKEDGDNYSPEAPPASAKVSAATDKQVRTIYDTVARITGMDNKEDMDKWLEEKVGATPDKLSVKAAGAVITKLFAAEKARKAEPVKPDIEDEVITDLPDEVSLDNVPY